MTLTDAAVIATRRAQNIAVLVCESTRSRLGAFWRQPSQQLVQLERFLATDSCPTRAATPAPLKFTRAAST